MKLSRFAIQSADNVILDEKSVIESQEYGGAYDVDPRDFFTRDDIVQLAEDVVDILNDTPFPEYHRFEYSDVYMTSPVNVTVEVTDGDYNFRGSARIDMRRIYRPQDILKYSREIVRQIEDDIQSIYSSNKLSRSYSSIFSTDDLDDNDLDEPDQEYDSSKTSINKGKTPAVFKLVKSWKPDTINLDYGGGKYDSATEYLKSLGVTNLIYDKYNRDNTHNNKVLKLIRNNGGADTATCSNVLNVIKEANVRNSILRNIKSLLKPNGTLYITVHEGNKDAVEGPTKSGYQLNRKTEGYLDEIREVFPDAERKGKLIIAHPNSTSKVTSNTHIPPSDIQKVSRAAADVQTEEELNKVISSLQSINRTLYLHFSSLAQSGKYSPAAIGKMISDELYYSINSSTKITADSSVNYKNIQDEINEAVRQILTSEAFGFEETEVPEYCQVDIDPIDGGVRIEVRAELSYSGMDQLRESLNKVITKYDADAYFEHVDGGIIDAYVYFNSITSSEAIMAYDVDDARNERLDPDNYYPTQEVADDTEEHEYYVDATIEVTNYKSAGLFAAQFTQIDTGTNDEYSYNYPNVKIADQWDIEDECTDAIVNSGEDPGGDGVYTVSAVVTVTYQIDRLIYTDNDTDSYTEYVDVKVISSSAKDVKYTRVSA